MSNKSGASEQVISLPKGGGALQGLGERFSPDLHTGTGNFTVPIALPPGRNGFQPQVRLVYSTGHGNGPFGLGWNLDVPSIGRATVHGVPRYEDGTAGASTPDTFDLSGVDELIRVSAEEGGVPVYRPRTEGLFAQVTHQRDADRDKDIWEVRAKDGLISVYGGLDAQGEAAVIADPSASGAARIFAWKLVRTADSFGNTIEYVYERDAERTDGPHHWDQTYLSEIWYADYGPRTSPTFLVKVKFAYESRPDPFSDCRAGFEIRTVRRCAAIRVFSYPNGVETPVRTYRLEYDVSRLNGVSLLSAVQMEGHGAEPEALPPLRFSYTGFEPEAQRDFFPITGAELPPGSLARSTYELADLSGDGLPDVLEMHGVVRYWRNLGGGRFDLPRQMRDAPAGLTLADPGVQLVDADGDGRIDLLVTADGRSEFYPLRFDGQWDRRPAQRYKQAPSFSLDDPEVKLVDLDGDGVTDVIRSGSRLECFFNRPAEGRWSDPIWFERRPLEEFPNVSFADARVKWGDMNGDGLQDILLVYDGNIVYWPNIGHGRWGKQVRMEHSPNLPYGYDPRRILIGDIDGDGLADLVYLDHGRVTLWINQGGNGWSDAVRIAGTAPVSDVDAVRLVDLLGTGISGVLWSADANGQGRAHLHYLDLTGAAKPYLLNQIDNNMGVVTWVEYAPSTRFYLVDQRQPVTRWRTRLPFPVQVVAKVEVVDHLSGGKLTTEYRYHHGYWDGAEREFRGFGMVEQCDSETFAVYNESGLHGPDTAFARIDDQTRFVPPTLTKTWFHQGAVADPSGAWGEPDYGSEYWADDPPMFDRYGSLVQVLAGLERQRDRRSALRALRGSVLRTEVYAQDGDQAQERPYTVTEFQYGLREELSPGAGDGNRWGSYFPHLIARRTTQWERGTDPMTRFEFIEDYDAYGQVGCQTEIACPRGWRSPVDTPADEYLATRRRTEYVSMSDAAVYIKDRVARTTSYEFTATAGKTVAALRVAPDSDPSMRIIGQTLHYYDLDADAPDRGAFRGLSFGRIGAYGALVRIDVLVLTDHQLQQAYAPDLPPYLDRLHAGAWPTAYPTAFQDRVAALPERAGYSYQPDADHAPGYFISTERRRYDFHDPPGGDVRGLVLERRDPLDGATRIGYDAYDLLAVRVEQVIDGNAAPPGNALTTSAEYDYRVFQVKQVTDPNGNSTAFRYSPLGLLRETWVLGKQDQTRPEGDVTRPSVRLEYDFLAFMTSPPKKRQPAWVRTVRQVHHDTETDVPLPERDETITTVEYSDGFGRLLQTRTQADALSFGDEGFGNAVLPADQSDAAGTAAAVVGRQVMVGPANVIVSGWQTYNNKGWVVEKFEPYFAEGWAYLSRAEAEVLRFSGMLNLFGQAATMYYDPLGRMIRTVFPDNSEQRIVHGVPGSRATPDLTSLLFEPTPWERYTYDANDNAERTHPGDPATSAYEHCWNTPSSVVVDALGRTVAGVARNRQGRTTPADPLGQVEEYRSAYRYDIAGNLISVTDPLGRTVFRHVYDLANRLLRSDSLDAGIRWCVLDAAGNLTESGDQRGARVYRAYDALQRPTHVWARDDNGAGSAVTLRERLIYGDSAGLSATQVADANLAGRLYQHYDEAGLLSYGRYDSSGNLLEKARRVIDDAQLRAVFAGAEASGWQIPVYRIDWEPATGVPLERHALQILAGASYEISTDFDALQRAKRVRYPTDVDGGRKELRPRYNRAGALAGVAFGGATYVTQIAYNARGQRTLIAYGNGVMTRYAYDARTFRLARLRTERFTSPVADSYQPAGGVLQDSGYAYDLGSNVRQIAERAPGCGVSGGPQGADALDRVFSYDALDRLTSATGRERSTIPAPRPWHERAAKDWNGDVTCGFYAPANPPITTQTNAPHLTSLYTEHYSYDPAGNLVALKHSNAWTRHFGVGGLSPQDWAQTWPAHLDGGDWPNPPGNQLTHAGNNQTAFVQSHQFDANGNLTREHTERHYGWDHSDRLREFRTQAGSAQPSVHAQYLYDADGQRVTKLVRRQGGLFELTVWVDGLFEYHRRVEGTVTNEHNTVHVLDLEQRIATVRVGEPFPDDGAPDVRVRYHLGDHLGSSEVVVGGAAATEDDFINREEYFPFGDSSFGSFGRKRYRFTGKERDEESSLYYHGARYYAPWLMRWISCDPLGASAGSNSFAYVGQSPLRYRDRTGLFAEPDPIHGADVPLYHQSEGDNVRLTSDFAKPRHWQSPGIGDLSNAAQTSAETIRPISTNSADKPTSAPKAGDPFREPQPGDPPLLSPMTNEEFAYQHGWFWPPDLAQGKFEPWFHFSQGDTKEVNSQRIDARYQYKDGFWNQIGGRPEADLWAERSRMEPEGSAKPATARSIQSDARPVGESNTEPTSSHREQVRPVFSAALPMLYLMMIALPLYFFYKAVLPQGLDPFIFTIASIGLTALIIGVARIIEWNIGDMPNTSKLKGAQ